jgi:prepilin-type N-terminal cleavage/methylation domain-containing protein
MKKNAFTLIELLVVIAVIAVLMGILMPSLQKAREQAKIIRCASNMRQIVLALSTYTESNDGKLPPSPSLIDPDGTGQNTGNYHRPNELNWRIGNAQGLVADPQSQKGYHYAGRYLGVYLEDAGAFNCPLSALHKNTPWPPTGAAQGSYGEFYQTGRFAPLHSTYTLLWNYQGFNHQLSNNVDKSMGHFVGAKTLASKTKLVVQDSFFYLTTNVNLLFDMPPQNSWCTAHPSKEGVRAFPYYVHKDLGGDDFPRFRFNAGFLDGRVESFMSWEALKVKNYGAINYLAPTNK